MNDEIELVSDGDGIALFGDSAAVEQFLSNAGLRSRAIDQRRFANVLSSGAGITRVGSEVASTSGRWVKLTETSAKALKAGELMKGPTADVSRAGLMKNGKTAHILQIIKTPTTFLTNPAMLAGAAGIMAQLAMQQTMDEITDYLAVIDEKVDDVLRAQKDAALAEMIGVGLAIDEAMIIREHTGRVSEVTWSKVQSASMVIARTQSYSLRQLDALAEKLEKMSNVGDLADVARAAESTVEEWLAVLARCFQLMDGIAVLELDRVLDTEPDAVDQHRVGVKAAREHRLALISQTTLRLLHRIRSSAGEANARVLLNPFSAGAVVRSSNEVATDVVEFNTRIGIAQAHDALEAKRWIVAAGEAGEKVRISANDVGERVRDTGVAGAGAARRFGLKIFGDALQATERISTDIADRAGQLRERRNEDDRRR